MWWETKNTCQWPIVLVISVPKKNCKRAVLVQFIIENVVTFLEHSVVSYSNVNVGYFKACQGPFIATQLNSTRRLVELRRYKRALIYTCSAARLSAVAVPQHPPLF